MSKWVYAGDPRDYATLGFSCVNGSILDASAAPDFRWTLNGDQGAAETVTRYVLGADPSYIEPTDGHILVWDAAQNRYAPRALLALDGDFAAHVANAEAAAGTATEKAAEATATLAATAKRPTGEKVFYVSKGTLASDANDGLTWGSAFSSINAAFTALNAAGGGRVEIGYGNFSATAKLVRPSGSMVRGLGKDMTTVTLAGGVNGNVIEDATWGSTSTIGYGGGVEGLTINANKSGQTHVAAQAFNTTTITLSGSPTTVYVRDASAWQTRGVTSGTLWIGDNLCNFTGLTNTGTAYDPANPTTTGWQFTGVTTVGGGSKTYNPEALITPGASWGHGIAYQSAYTVTRDVNVLEPMGSGACYQGTQGASAVENRRYGCRTQRANRYSLEISPNAPDGVSEGETGANGKLGDLLAMSVNWDWGSYHPQGVWFENHNGRNAPYAVVIAAAKHRFKGVNFDSFPGGLVQINLAWRQQHVDSVRIDGDVFRASWAGSGHGTVVSFYGQQDNAALAARGIDVRMGMRGRFLRQLDLQPTTETALVSGGSYTTPASGAAGTNLQVLSTLAFSPLGSAVAGTLQLINSAGATIDTISYTDRSAATAWTSATVSAGATSLPLDDATDFAAGGGTVAVMPQSTSTAPVASHLVTYTGKTGNTLTGIPASGTGSIPEALPLDAGVSQHYLTGVRSTGAGGVTVPDGTTVVQVNRRITNASVQMDTDSAQHRRNGTPVYPMSGVSGAQVRLRGMVLDKPNPMAGSVTIGVGSASASVAHNLNAKPTTYGATPIGDPQQRFWVTADATNITVNLAANAVGSSVAFQVWGGNSPA